MTEKSQTFGKYFFAFADSNLHISLKRIANLAQAMYVYDGIYVYNETDLNTEFRKKYKEHLILRSRGYGYWSLKPQVILQVFNLIDEGDVVQYCDVVCHLNPKGSVRLEDYFNITKQSENGVLVLRCKTREELSPGELFYHYDDINYTKDLIEYFGIAARIDLLKRRQFAGTIGFFRKHTKTIEFLKNWSKVYETDFALVDDTSSKIQIYLDFSEQRQDQCIFLYFARLPVSKKYLLRNFTHMAIGSNCLTFRYGQNATRN